jgi:quinol-cytochrome oxidoreductase complex cytochrome b subunit
MKILRETALLLRNTVLVTLAVVFGFWAAGAFSLPLWLWFPCLLPAGYLFLRLSEEKPPYGWKLLGFFSICSVTLSIYLGLVSPHVSDKYQTLGLSLMTAINLKLIYMPAHWLEARLAKQISTAGSASFSGKP